MKKTIITLLVISFILMFSTASGAEKSDSLFMRYEAVYPAFRPIVDSLLNGCPEDCAYIMDLHRNTGSERTQILVQRFEYNNAGLFDTTDCYGVISDEYNFIYLYGDKECDLLLPTGECIAAASCDKSNLEDFYLDDSNMSMYIFDKLRLYMVCNDLRLRPISEIRLSNKYPYHIVDIYGCPVYTPEYVSNNGTIKFACQYFMKNGDDVHAVRHFPDILVKRGSVKLRKYVAKNYPREYLSLSVVFFYDPVTGYFEVRHCNNYCDPMLKLMLEDVIKKNCKMIVRKIDKKEPCVVRIFIDL